MTRTTKDNWQPALITAGSRGEAGNSETTHGWRFMAAGGSPKRTVEAERRRKVGTPAGQRPRAEAPQRRESGSGGGAGGGFSSSGGGGGGMGLPLPGGKGGRSIASIALLLILLCVFFAFQQFGGGSDQGGQEAQFPEQQAEEFQAPEVDSQQPAAEPADLGDFPTGSGQLASLPPAEPFESAVTQAAAPAAAPAKAGQTWTVLLYQDADDKILEQDIYLDLNEAERAGSTDQVKVVAQVDRFSGAYSGDGDWTGTRRYLITKDDNLNRVGSKMVQDLGEANMSDGQTLVDFVTWGIQNYPADKYVLILSDHGMGWPGGWSDPTSKSRGDSRIPLAARLGDELYLNELDAALAEIRSQTGLDQFEMIGMDACLMGQLEVFTALAPHARYAVASQEVEPALGWAYTGFLQALNENPQMDGGQLGKLIVGGYIEEDQRILDPGARSEFLSQNSPMGGLFGRPSDIPPKQLARQIGQSSTLTAVDLSQIGVVNERLNQLAFVFQSAKQQILAGSRTYAQNFTSIFGSEVPPSYIDLGNFLEIVKQKTSDAQVNQAADALLAALNQAVIAEKHGPKKPGATGVAIYFPNSQLYQNPVTGAVSYTAIADRFASESLWDDFLAFHYTGQKFEAAAVGAAVPPTGSAVRAPGSGAIQITNLSLSGIETAPGETIKLSADISGENIGYIYLFVGFYDPQGNSVFIADQDYLESGETREANGVYYPEWGEGDFSLTFDWEPVVFAINDGTNRVTALFRPESFGESFEQAIYTVDGTYTFADSGEQRAARLFFSNGVLRQVYGFTKSDGAGAPREITPTAGDTFTVTETWLDLDQNGQVTQRASQAGGTLTFGNQMFTWEPLDAAAGEYIIGFIVEDLDGNQQQTLGKITVR